MPDASNQQGGEPDHYLYFCYGSNMDRDKFTGRAPPGMAPITYSDAWIGRVRDWALCFNVRGVPPMEPCMGSLKRAEGDTAYGMVYRIDSAAAWKSLLGSEGVREDTKHIATYEVVEVPVEIYKPDAPDDVRRITAYTLTTNPSAMIPPEREPMFRPSGRYLDMMRSAARRERLPEAYIEKLDSLEPARQWTPSPLTKLIKLTVPLYFMRQNPIMRALRAPLATLMPRLYVAHEQLMERNSSGPLAQAQLLACRTAMFALGFMHVPVVLLALLISPRARRMLAMMRKINHNKHIKPQKPTDGDAGENERKEAEQTGAEKSKDD